MVQVISVGLAWDIDHPKVSSIVQVWFLYITLLQG